MIWFEIVTVLRRSLLVQHSVFVYPSTYFIVCYRQVELFYMRKQRVYAVGDAMFTMVYEWVKKVFGLLCPATLCNGFAGIYRVSEKKTASSSQPEEIFDWYNTRADCHQLLYTPLWQTLHTNISKRDKCNGYGR